MSPVVGLRDKGPERILKGSDTGDLQEEQKTSRTFPDGGMRERWREEKIFQQEGLVHSEPLG